jgi:hypothetical protein
VDQEELRALVGEFPGEDPEELLDLIKEFPAGRIGRRVGPREGLLDGIYPADYYAREES